MDYARGLTPTDIVIENIGIRSRFLTDVKELGRRNSRTMGFFPDGAFDEYAARNTILVARTEASEFAGYLLYRLVQKGAGWPHAVIVHLCVAEQWRKRGVAKLLVEELRQKLKDSCSRLELNCRRDFPATQLWPRLGFVCRGERTGKVGLPIATWEMIFRQLPLLGLLEEAKQPRAFRAVIDVNVIIRLQDPISTESEASQRLSEEAKALQAEWLANEIDLIVTDETFNEIAKRENNEERNRRRTFIRSFERAVTDLDRTNEIERLLQKYIETGISGRNDSDIRQLAHAIAAGAHFFITQDTDLARGSEQIHSEFGIQVLSPGEFVTRVDEVIREAEYQPARLSGSGALKKARARAADLPQFYSALRAIATSEKKSQFDGRVRNYMANTARYQVEVCSQHESLQPLALRVFERLNAFELAVPMLRVSNNPLAGTVLRHLLLEAVLTSAREGRWLTRIADAPDTIGFQGALAELGFTPMGKDWIKCNLAIAADSTAILSLLARLAEQHSGTTVIPLLDSLVVALSTATAAQDPVLLLDLERRLWPCRILDANVNTYVVPVRPYWAQHLFDQELANQTLWGGREDLVLGNEKVYYRAKRSSWPIESPARILWYISGNQSYQGSMSIRACSFLDEVVVGSAKDLYRRFKRLGIYGWKDVLGAANNNPYGTIMAMRFSYTERFRSPLPLAVYRNVMREIGDQVPVLQSPQLIKPETFAQIYLLANGDTGGDPS